MTAVATPGHAPAHHAYAVADRRRGGDDPWLVFGGGSLLIGDVGRPDLHVARDAHGRARLLHPFSSIGFERLHNPLLSIADAAAFADALVAEMPPRPVEQERIVAANRSGNVGAPA